MTSIWPRTLQWYATCHSVGDCKEASYLPVVFHLPLCWWLQGGILFASGIPLATLLVIARRHPICQWYSTCHSVGDCKEASYLPVVFHLPLCWWLQGGILFASGMPLATLLVIARRHPIWFFLDKRINWLFATAAWLPLFFISASTDTPLHSHHRPP